MKAYRLFYRKYLNFRKATNCPLTSEEFCQKYLPTQWAEKDLQLYIQRVLQSKWINLRYAPDEVPVHTATARRRIDISTWHSIYEVKCFLTYDNIYHAVGQSELYCRCGSKIGGFIRKRRVIIGVAPTDYKELLSAAKLADDFNKLKGIKIVFINCHPEWHIERYASNRVNKWLVYAVIFLLLFICSFLIAVFI